MRKLVVYDTADELFVVDLDDEDAFLDEYFKDDCGRDLDDFDRSVVSGAVEIMPRASWTANRIEECCPNCCPDE